MRSRYPHLSAYSCDKCAGPVVAVSLAVRENEISKESGIREVGALCLSCGYRQSKATEPRLTRYFPPAQWESTKVIGVGPDTAENTLAICERVSVSRTRRCGKCAAETS